MNYYKKVMVTLVKNYPEKAASEKKTAWECLLFTALTARSRDDQVEPVFQKLMTKYPTIQAMSKAKLSEVENSIATIGLYHAKARAAIGMAKMLIERFGGRVPETIEELVQLPGVGRKTASCVLVYSFHKDAIPVDTHVHRIVNRLGWVKTSNAEKPNRN